MAVVNCWIHMQFRVIKCGPQPRTIRTPDFILLPWSLFRGLKLQKQTVLRRSVSRRQLANRPFNAVVTRCTEKRNTPAVIAACSHEQAISRGVGRLCNRNRALLRSVPQSEMFTMRWACKEHEIRTELGWKASGTKLFKICSFILVRPPVEQFSSPRSVERRFS